MNFELVHEKAKLPTRGSEEAAGLDLYAVEGCLINPGEIAVVPLGIKSVIMRGWVGLIRDRSGNGSKGWCTQAGVIDSDYRGEWKVVCHNRSLEARWLIEPGYRIAQVVFVQHYTGPITETLIDEETGRGIFGFGSTGQ